MNHLLHKFLLKISACKGTMKESWKTINELLNKRSKSSNIDGLKESGSETVHRKDIPDAMKSYFCSVGKDLADKSVQLQIPSYQVTLK